MIWAFVAPLLTAVTVFAVGMWLSRRQARKEIEAVERARREDDACDPTLH